MKLTEKDIGKQVRRKSSFTPYVLLAVKGDDLWISTPEGTEAGKNDGFWIVVEPEKKPSERIDEIFNQESANYAYCDRWVNAILKFLDEEFEKQKK